ncbi:hypothetical protein SLE2022_117170 [Rubroshorea leprosula]
MGKKNASILAPREGIFSKSPSPWQGYQQISAGRGGNCHPYERFRDSLIKHLAATFNEVNDRSLKFITIEEYALSQKPVLAKNQNPAWRDEGQSKKQMKTI